MLIISTLGIVISIILIARKLKLFTGHLFSNAFKIMLFISDAQYYIPVTLCRTSGSIHLFKITLQLLPEDIKLKRNIVWDVMEIDWKEVNVTPWGYNRCRSKVCTLKGIYTFWKDYKMQMTKCSPWGNVVQPYPPLKKKMIEFIRHQQTITTLFANRPAQPKPKAAAKNTIWYTYPDLTGPSFPNPEE